MRWQDRWTVIPAVYLILEKDSKILLMRRHNTGYQDGNYSLPAGHLDGGEPATLALTREAKEEIGIDLDVSELELLHTMHRIAEEGNHERLDLYFRAKKWQGEPTNMEPHKCDELRWVSRTDLPENVIPVVAQALACIRTNQPYSDFGF
jgi:8-oxo-dGTP diphosphatase